MGLVRSRRATDLAVLGWAVAAPSLGQWRQADDRKAKFAEQARVSATSIAVAHNYTRQGLKPFGRGARLRGLIALGCGPGSPLTQMRRFRIGQFFQSAFGGVLPFHLRSTPRQVLGRRRLDPALLRHPRQQLAVAFAVVAPQDWAPRCRDVDADPLAFNQEPSRIR